MLMLILQGELITLIKSYLIFPNIRDAPLSYLLDPNFHQVMIEYDQQTKIMK